MKNKKESIKKDKTNKKTIPDMLTDLIKDTMKVMAKTIAQQELENYERWLVHPNTKEMSARYFIKWQIDILKDYLKREHNISDSWKEELAVLNDAALNKVANA